MLPCSTHSDKKHSGEHGRHRITAEIGTPVEFIAIQRIRALAEGET